MHLAALAARGVSPDIADTQYALIARYSFRAGMGWGMMMYRSGFMLVLAAFAAACTEGTLVDTQAEKEFTPPEIYRTWYDEAMQCSGLAGDFDRIRWIEAEVFVSEGVGISGAWVPPHTIYLDPELVEATCDTVPGGGPCFRQQNVKHEMIHDLRQAGHDGYYPDSASVFIRCSTV